MEGIKRRREFEEALRNIISKMDREGKDRLDRSEVEEIGERYELDPEKARKLFLDSRGDVWEGELIDDEGESEWEAVRLDRAPASGDDLSV